MKALHLWNVREGNIVFEVKLLDPDQIENGHIESAYELSDIARDQEIEKLLTSAREEGLRLLEMTTSYGAEGVVLFKGIALFQGHRAFGETID